MSYLRVVPRDLFNESKLLKCLGRISVDILDNKLAKYGVENYLEDEYEGFKISQNDDGDISCDNFKVTVPMKGISERIYLNLFSRLNSKDNYPLVCETHEHEYLEVFTDEGKYTKEFIDYLKFLNKFKG